MPHPPGVLWLMRTRLRAAWLIAIVAALACWDGEHHDNTRERSDDIVACDSLQWAAARVFARSDVRLQLGRATFPDSSTVWVPLGNEGDERVVVGASWNAPNAGALLVFTCNGSLAGATPTGRIDSLWLPELGHGVPQLVAVLSTGTQATSYRATNISLFSVADEIPHLIWSTETRRESFTSPSVNDSAMVTFDTSGVITRRLVHLTQANRRSAVDRNPPLERYLWSADQRVFMRKDSDSIQ